MVVVLFYVLKTNKRELPIIEAALKAQESE
jgi:hypothetical protein